MTKPSKSNNSKHIKKYSELKQKILHIFKANHLGLKNKSVTPRITSCKYYNRDANKQNASLIKEWKKWLFHYVIVNVCGNNITGILVQLHTDHLTLVSECDIYVIPTQHVTFICYRSN